jgi:FkbM family methyltransferase
VPSPEAIARTAEQHFARRDSVAAEAFLLGAAQENANDPVVAGAVGKLLLWRLQDHVRALPLVERALTVAPQDADLLTAHAYATWIQDQRNPTAGRALDSILRAADLRPGDGAVYRIMGMIALSRRNFALAQMALTKAVSLGINCALYLALADALLSERGEVSFSLEGQTYSFALTTYSTQTIEAGSFHCAGALTELAELNYLRDKVAPGGVIAEVGVLVGNHSAFFLRNFRPRKLLLFDADPGLIPIIRANVDRNNSGTEIAIHNAFIADTTADSLPFVGQSVPARRLSDLVTGKIDFLKIDVDGAEVDCLRGAAAVIETYRPFVMIEVTPITRSPVENWFRGRGYQLLGQIDHGSYCNLFWKYGTAAA